MATLEGVVRVCDRHFGGDVVATRSITFVIDGHRYEIDVCDEHGTLFDLNLGPWVRCAHELTAGLGEPAPEQVEVARQRVVRPAEPLVVVRTVERVEPEPVLEPEPVEVPDISGIDPDVMRAWRFTKLASDTLADLRLTAVDVWRILQAPERTSAGMTPDTKVWSGQRLDVVVNPSTRTVITAYRPRRMSA